MVPSFLFPRRIDSAIAGLEEAEEPSGGKVLRLIQIFLTTVRVLKKIPPRVKAIRRKRESPSRVPEEPKKQFKCSKQAHSTYDEAVRP
jgi:hypothetical protein